MHRMACIDLPAFPLPLLLMQHSDWRAYAAAVVEDDRANAPILWVNERARKRGVLPGQRYAHALSLAKDLRAGVMPPKAILQSVLIHVFQW